MKVRATSVSKATFVVSQRIIDALQADLDTERETWVDPFEDCEVFSFTDLKGLPHSPFAVAIIAAVLNPGACINGEPRAALENAWNLLREAGELCEGVKAANSLAEVPIRDSRWLKVVLKNVRKKTLFLPANDRATQKISSDALDVRSYFIENLNFEGTGVDRAAWSRVRTVRENLGRFLTWRTNLRNLRAAQRQSKGGASTRRTSEWCDADAEIKRKWREWHAQDEPGWNIPLRTLKEFCRWRRAQKEFQVRQKEIRPLSRKDVEAFVARYLANK